MAKVVRPLVWLSLPVAVIAVGIATIGRAESVTPERLGKALAGASGGDTIVLAPGDYGRVSFPPRRYAPALRIDASRARFTGLTLRKVSGVTIAGGTVTGPVDQVFGIAIDSSDGVRIEGMAISGSRIGVTVSRSHDVAVVGNDFAGTRSDGVNIAMSQEVRVERNRCVDFQPIQAVYAADGKLVRDGDHPDCVQAWSSPGYPATGGLTIVGNTAVGFMQGIFIRNPWPAPAFERIVVRDNVLSLSAFNGIIVADAKDSEVSGNVVNTVKGSVLGAYPHPRITSWIRVTGERNRVCGNVVGAEPKGEGTRRCR